MRLLPCLLIVSLVASGCAKPGPDFPNAYLVQGAAVPQGWQLCAPSGGLANPYDAPVENLTRQSNQFGNATPKRFIVERLEPTGVNTTCSQWIIIFSTLWASEADVAKVLDNIREIRTDPCKLETIRGLRDRTVVVILTASNNSTQMKQGLDAVEATLRTQAPGLRDFCA